MDKDILDINSLIGAVVISLLVFLLGLVNFFTPFESFLTDLSDSMIDSVSNTGNNWSTFLYVYKNINDVKSENAELTEKTAKLEAQVIDLKRERQNVEHVLNTGLANFNRNYEYIPARVIFLIPDEKGEAIINKGTSDGIEKGDVVVSGNIALGEIIDTKTYQSTLKFIGSPGYKLNVITLGGTRGILVGDIKSEFRVEQILTDTTLAVSDVFVTEGRDEKYPYGLYVGEVEEISTEESNPTKNANLKSHFDYKLIDNIYIIKPK